MNIVTETEYLIDLISSGRYDPEIAHDRYDRLLEEIIKSNTATRFSLDLHVRVMFLISLPKNFHYA